MTPMAARWSRHGRRLIAGLAAALALAASGFHNAAYAIDSASVGAPVVRVMLDQAKIIKAPEQTSTLVVGNPLIADVSVQPGGVLVITGKSYGVTNLIALDRNGSTLMQEIIEVSGPGGHVVVVYRGIERETYSCTPECERRITLGDTPNYFNAALTQSGTLTSQAQGTQPSK